MKKIQLLLVSILALAALHLNMNDALATHIRAGELTFKRTSAASLTYEITLIVYTDTDSGVDNPTATIVFGDGSQATVTRNQGDKRFINQGPNGTAINIYKIIHTFPAAGSYTVTYTEVNRNANIQNLPQPSDQVPFSIESLIIIDPFLGLNDSPILLATPVDFACIGQRFTHNPAAYDVNGDSLSYKLLTPKRAPNRNIAGYVNPDKVDPIGNSESGGASVFSINAITGDVVWDAPYFPNPRVSSNEFSIAFAIEEWRNGVRIGYVVRDMQIVVTDCKNRRPNLTIPNNICVEAGTFISQTIRATDPDNNTITLSANGGIFTTIDPPFTAPYINKGLFRSTFTQPQAQPATATFSWQTDCEHVRKQFYEVVFKAEDNPPPPQTRKLADIKSWLITVIGKRPTNLKATPSGRSMILNWDTYACTNKDIQLIIWRREGCNNWTPSSCESGVPSYTGYVQIGKVAVGQTTFTDNNNGVGLKKGLSYSYRVSAVYPQPTGGESYASNEACANILIDVPLITKVSVESTNKTTGSITVKWTKPFQNDAALFPTPYVYKLYRAEGLTGTNFVEVTSSNSTADTMTFVDTGLNTQDLAYNYRVGFFYGSSQAFKDYSDPATSVRLTATSISGGIQLNWNYNTPWTNANRKHAVYRQINGVFEKIADVNVGPTTATATFSDFGTYKGLRLRTQDSYCYYVQTNGSYSNPLILDPLLNKSQVACASPKDDQPPCPPTLEIDIQDCQNYNDAAPIQNVLKWKKTVTGTVNGVNCIDDIEKYRLYYSPTDPGDYKLIAELPDLTFTHGDLQSFAGCYYVTAVDFAGNESEKSNIVCKDNCIRYDLPNVFSPNGDGKNDLYQPYPGYRFVESVKFKVVNRWGATVFSTEEININWNGSDLPAGTYFYSAEVKFTRVRLKEANQVLQGWIQLIR